MKICRNTLIAFMMFWLVPGVFAHQNCSFSIRTEDQSSKNAEILVTQIEHGLKTKKIVDTIEKTLSTITGVPKTVKKIEVQPAIVFRQYVGHGIDEIIERSELKSGNLPYIIAGGGGSREFYESLTGVFLTSPNVSPSEVGLPANKNYDYVDFVIHTNTGLLQIEEKIFLIPGMPEHPQWLIDRYQKWIKNDYNPSSEEVEIFEKMKLSKIERVLIPIKILQYRKNGSVVKL
ncbi:MAG: hypothetical protein KA715_02460 [Xanthomonadaceae bacterium]|nr:hypothetical protein [Xanthomonadaceae bacterium]